MGGASGQRTPSRVRSTPTVLVRLVVVVAASALGVGSASAANPRPEAVNDALSTFEDTAGSTEVLVNDTDPEVAVLAVTRSADGAHGAVTCLGTGLCTYIPAAGFHGSDSFTYTVGDGRGGTSTGTVDVTVYGVDDVPVAVDDSLSTAVGTAGLVGVLGNDTDVDGDLLTLTDETDGAHGTVVCTVGGSCTYTPVAGYVGADAFHYTVDDGQGATDVGTVAVTLTPGRPTAADVSVVVSRVLLAIEGVVGAFG